MSNLSQNFQGEQEHPPQEDFLLYVDGELSPRETERWESHLDACWACRTRVAKIEGTITEIIDFENTVSQFQSTHATRNWGNFDSLLREAALEPHPRTFTDRILEFWKNGGSRFLHSPLRVAFSSVAALLIVAVVYNLVLVPPVTAAEILRLSTEAQAARINETEQPVLHQRLLVRTGSGSDRVPLEIWNDTVNSRVRVTGGADLSVPPAVTGGKVLSVPPAVAGGDFNAKSQSRKDAKRTEQSKNSPPYEGGVAPASGDGLVLSDLRSILIANRMNEHRPLSAASYQSWTNSLTDKTETVEAAQNKFTIHTTNSKPTNDQITEARFTVRADDYHPTSLYIKTSNHEFELIEQSYEVVSLKDIDPAIFADPTKIEIASTIGTTPKAETSASPAEPITEEATNTTANSLPPTIAATTADEVEVLNRLHQIGADITEQLNVTRTADGRLLVEGLVETDTRKQEILNALAPVRNNPAIRIKVQTIEEATRALQRQKAQATPGTVERVEVEKGKLAVDAELRAYFERSGGDPDDKIRAFVSRVINRSKGAAFQASALNRMANRFNAEQLAALDPGARSKYLGMLKGYAAAVRRETAALRAELQPVFGDVSDAGGESVTSDADLIASARRLYELAAQNDRVIRSAFTISTGGASVSAIKSAQFRRSLGQAESLAAAIERAR